MLKTLAVAAVASASAVVTAHLVAKIDPASQAAAAPAQVMAVQAAPEARSAAIARSPDGHFWAEAKVDGARVRFLVDTGATAVSLTPEDAVRLGLEPASLDYDYKVTTASGEARAAKVTLTSIAVGEARVFNVDAFVIEQGLAQSLLGMSYLGRLSKIEATPSSLILRS